MINEDENDIKSQIEQLRANRANRTRVEKIYNDDDYTTVEDDKPEKKDEGVLGVVIFQCILAVVIAIIYVLFLTFNRPIANEMKNTVIEKNINDFSFKDKVYDTVANIVTYLNKVEPIDIKDISDENVNASGDIIEDSSSNSSSESTLKVEDENIVDENETASEKKQETEQKENEEDKKDEEDLDKKENEDEQNGAGGKLNPVGKNEMPLNATFAPVVHTGRITFPIKDNYRISSPYGFREHPSSSVPEFHTGVDIAAPKSTPIMAAADGVVIKSTQGQSLGNYIIIDHSKGFLTLYGHCDKLIAKEGANIREGEIIAKVGNTGDSTGNHLHFAMKKDGIYFDPAYIFEDEIDVEV